MPRTLLALEKAGLRQQLGAYLHTRKRPRLRRGHRVFWVILAPAWAGSLVIVVGLRCR